MSGRSRRMILLAQENKTSFGWELDLDDHVRISSIPKYETTKGTNYYERELALRGSQELFGQDILENSFSEDEDSGSEYHASSEELESTDEDEGRKWNKKKNPRSKKYKSRASSDNRNIPNVAINESNEVRHTDEEVPYNNDNLTDSGVAPTEPDEMRVTSTKEDDILDKPSSKLRVISNILINPPNTSKNTVSSTTNTPPATKSRYRNNDRLTLVNISAAETNVKGKRIRNKHCCYYCHVMVLHIARHLEILHEKEMDVSKALSLPKSSKKRKEIFAEITRAGDFHHNCEVISLKQGELILVRRPTVNEIKFNKYTDYGPCPNCLGFFLKKNLWHHLKSKCAQKKSDFMQDKDAGQANRHVIAESNAILSNVFGSELSSEYKKCIVNTLRDDEVGNFCRDDNLIMKFGAMYFEKYGSTQSELIRQNMRQLARLTMTIQELTSLNLTLADLLTPTRFDYIVQGVKHLCKAQQNDRAKRPEFGTPSLALKLGHSLKKCANIERGVALRQENLRRNENLLAFCNLMELEWQIRVSGNALSTLYKRKLNTGQLLPVTSDLLKCNNYIKEELVKAQDLLIKSPTAENWSRLSKLVLCRIILFNKRRAGEASKMTIEQYNNRPLWRQEATEELKKTLTAYEVKLAERHIIINIIGKRGRMVPVLLTPEAKSAIDILISYRSKANGVGSENPYIFATKSHERTHMRGSAVLRDVLKEIEQLERPDLITSTKLRKYVATVCQMFDLKENEYDWLARHLGHDIKVHREFYRLHEDVVELTKVSRLLMAVDTGEANRFAGMPLKDIKLADLPEVEEEEEEEVVEKELKNDNEVNRNERGLMEDFIDEEEPLPEECRISVVKGRKRRTTAKTPWELEEKKAVFEYFRVQIKRGIVPGKADCEECQRQNPVLKNRKWTDLKFCVKNQITKLKRAKKN